MVATRAGSFTSLAWSTFTAMVLAEGSAKTAIGHISIPATSE